MDQMNQDNQAMLESLEKSNSSSFEDLSNESKDVPGDINKENEPMDILGNGQLMKKVN